jgi:hypothetical protein
MARLSKGSLAVLLGLQVCGGGLLLGFWAFVVFAILKLAEVGKVDAWSWWWVTSPLWIPVGFILGIVVLYLAYCIVGAIICFLIDLAGRRSGPRRAWRAY